MTVTLPERPAHSREIAVSKWRTAIEQSVDDDAKVEILGGEVIVSPMARNLHMFIVTAVRRVLDGGCDPKRFIVTERVEFVIDESNCPQPDVAVVSTESVLQNLDATVLPAACALLVVEVASPSNGNDDRKWGRKYKAYAKGLVPIYVLVDPHAEAGPSVTVFTGPTGTRYNTETTVKFGELLRLPEPFDAVEIDSGGFPVPAP